MKECHYKTKVFIYTWIYALILSPIFFIVSKFIDGNFNTYYLIGFLLGVVVSLFSFSLIVKSSKKISEENKNIQQSYFFTYIIRLLIYGIVLFVAYESKNISVITTALGFFSVKAVIVIMIFILKEEDVEKKAANNEEWS